MSAEKGLYNLRIIHGKICKIIIPYALKMGWCSDMISPYPNTLDSKP